MRPFEKALIGLLQAPAGEKKAGALAPLRPAELAELYVAVAFLRSALEFLGEQHWLRTRDAAPENKVFTFESFLEPFLSSELKPILFLHELLRAGTLADANALKPHARAAEALTLEHVIELPGDQRRAFVTGALGLLVPLFAFEAKLQEECRELGIYLGLSLYRTFDGIDQVLGLDYTQDLGMRHDPAEKERLYEGGGVGVQSGYSTVLNALRHLDPAEGARVIDLGSGYGRVALALGLLRPDLKITGYEFVEKRTNVALASARGLGLDARVRFLTQDLAAPGFRIPDAEIYYLYDPFTESTYAHVLAQLVAVARRQPIVIVTKGNARRWLDTVAKTEGWPLAREFDGGNLCLFASVG
jgi:hypothetical protein